MKEITEFIKELGDKDISKEEVTILLKNKYESTLPPIKMAQKVKNIVVPKNIDFQVVGITSEKTGDVQSVKQPLDLNKGKDHSDIFYHGKNQRAYTSDDYLHWRLNPNNGIIAWTQKLHPSPYAKQITENYLNQIGYSLNFHHTPVLDKSFMGWDKWQKRTLAQKDKRQPKEQIPEEKDTTCPMPLLNEKIEEINELFWENKYYEIMSICDQLQKEYGQDENVSRLIAVSVFGVLSRDLKYQNNNVLLYLFEKADKNIFDYVLCSYVLGILLLIETETDKNTIVNIGKRVITMCPTLVKKIFEKLPHKIFHNKLKNKLEKTI